MSSKPFPTSSKSIDANELRSWLSEGRPVTILDVRPTEQRRDWFVPGSLHQDLYERLKVGDSSAVADLDLPRDLPVVTVCAAGRTSLVAAEGLTERGYEVYSLEGGMKSWSGAWNVASIELASGVEVLQVRRTGKGCLSYLLLLDGEALVIDAALDPQVFIDLARERRAKIVGAIDTHVHADHLSRSRPLAQELGVPLYLPIQDRVDYHFSPVDEGDAIKFGGSALRVLSTPGHTWESASYLLPGEALFTGDTLFVDGVGRPDLEARPGEAAKRAGAVHRSLQRLLALPGDLLVFPGHSSRPLEFDGEIWAAPLSEIRTRVDLLQLDREAFVERVIAHLPATPENHVRIVQLNEAGRFPEEASELEAGGNRCAVG